MLNTPGEQKTAALGDRSSDADRAGRRSPPPRSGRFRWPARGRVIAAFGKRPDGTHNDGINIAVPQGTEIHAAESGRVAYAGNELKGYGNLVLIRHDNGWVSAYAHADQILVKRDDVVQARPGDRQGRQDRHRRSAAAALRAAPGRQAGRSAAAHGEVARRGCPDSLGQTPYRRPIGGLGAMADQSREGSDTAGQRLKKNGCAGREP